MLPRSNGNDYQDSDCKPIQMTWHHADLNVGYVKMTWILCRHGVKNVVVENA